MSSSKRARIMTPGSTKTTTKSKKKKSTKWYGQSKKAPLVKPLRYRSAGFPEQMTMKLKYAENIRHTITAGFVQYVWRANGIYDPNVTGTGHQPMYFDQMMALYNHFVVISSHIRATPFTGAVVDLMFAGYIDDDATGTTTMTTAIEKPGSHVEAGIPSQYRLMPIDLYWKSENAFGKDIMANSELHGTAAADPTEQSYYIFALGDPAAGTTSNVDVAYEIWYDVVFFERKDVSAS